MFSGGSPGTVLPGPEIAKLFAVVEAVTVAVLVKETSSP